MFLRVLLLLLGLQAASSSFSPIAHAKGNGHGYRVVAANKFEAKAICFALRVIQASNRTWLPLYHRHGPCSPPPSGQRIPYSMAFILRRDQVRADAIQRRLSRKGPSGVSTALGTALGLGTLEYVIAVGLGTPSVRQTVLMDTGSDLSWVQCRPCSLPPCHRQRDAVFDPSKSSTYSPFRCGSPACARLAADNTTNGCSGSNTNRCGYVVKYGDGSNTTGTYSSDTLMLTPSDVVVNFRFGCSHDITGFADTDLTDGLLGLGGDAQSLVSQAGKRAFSYCLPPTASHTGFFTLGVLRVSASRFAVTPLYRSAQSATFYLVKLQAITVAGRRLDVPPSVFSAGAIMDSGTIITRLPPAAYRELRAAFRAEMINMYPPAPPAGILDTCFNLTSVRHLRVPRVALVFDRGVAVELLNGDYSGWLPCVRLQPCAPLAWDHWQRAAEDTRGALRCRRRGSRIPAWRLLIQKLLSCRACLLLLLQLTHLRVVLNNFGCKSISTGSSAHGLPRAYRTGTSSRTIGRTSHIGVFHIGVL